MRPDRASGIAREQIADPVYKRQYDLMLDTSITTPEAGAAAVRKLMGERSRLAFKRALARKEHR
jgi:chloramphenicol 3-O-phosphotransferase